jgi:3-dehydroquinate synthase
MGGRYDVAVSSGSLRHLGEWASACLEQPAKRIVIISNPTVYRLYGDAATRSLKRSGYEVLTWLMKDGERHKNERSLNSVLEFLGEHQVSRSDAILSLGGGVVGDLAGFAASVYLRGIALLQAPTTLLAMIDSSVGGKTGINTKFGKNLVGAFYQPNGVLIDIETLQTLPVRELIAGFCEAVKQGALSGRKLFDKTADLLDEFPPARLSQRFESPELQRRWIDLIRSQVAFKAAIVRGDPFDDPARTDAGSRKILNFGHTFAHAIEKATNYRYLRHGEAVGHGMIFAAELSKILDIGNANELKLLNDVVHRVGPLPTLDNIDRHAVLAAFKFDKKIIAGAVQWVLLNKIGEPVILSGADVPAAAVNKAINIIFRRR